MALGLAPSYRWWTEEGDLGRINEKRRGSIMPLLAGLGERDQGEQRSLGEWGGEEEKNGLGPDRREKNLRWVFRELIRGCQRFADINKPRLTSIIAWGESDIDKAPTSHRELN
jgi:hypothetical protein